MRELDKPSPNYTGLSEADAAGRLRLEGPNELPQARPKSNLVIAAHVLSEPMFLLLLAVGTIYLVIGSIQEALALVGAIAFVIGITLYQERKTERTLEALRDLSSPRALVIRDGKRQRIAGREVVRGDLLFLSEGDRVAADALVVTTSNLTVDESLLTGESVPVRKAVWDHEAGMRRPGGEDSPSVFSGTLVIRGRGTAIVQATGSRTEMGKLGRSLQAIAVESTNIQRETRSIVRFLATVSLALCVTAAIVYGLTRGDWLQGALAGLALAISMVPEEFPVVLTVFLAIGAWRISKKRVLTRQVHAIEMLGSATALCVDKTGTLTMNRMTLAEIVPAQAADANAVLQAAVFASNENPIDPMERALVDAARNHTADSAAVCVAAVCVKEYPLSSDLLAMSRVWKFAPDGSSRVFTKGAPEAIADLCRMPTGEIASLIQHLAERGLRVLAVARGSTSVETLPDSQRGFQFEFLGLVGFEDPVRPSVPAAIRQCYEAGIRVVMITGDYPLTAHTVARRIGLQNPEQSLTGDEIAAMSVEELGQRAREVNIFARVMPEQKLSLVRALKANGDIVAMTGDGVNDAPALKAAHIGIAMGGRGTDVAREAASLVLLDDDFSSIVEAIRLGRRIYDNLKKAMTYIIAIHIPIAGLSLLPVLFHMPLVLMPLHIVFLELVIDPACSIAFESEPENPDIMRRRPRDIRERLFDRQTIRSAVLQGLSLCLIAFAAFGVSLYRGQGELDARAITFTTLVLGNIALIWANRSRSRTILQMLRSRNKPLWSITAAAALLLSVVLYVPAVREVFQFSNLHVNDILVCIGLALLSVTGIEIMKLRHAE